MVFAQGSKRGHEPTWLRVIFKNVSRSAEGLGVSFGFESMSVFSAGDTRRGTIDRTRGRGATPQCRH